ncbi:MAG: HRDC domain-containing protein [Prevotella sp.]
MQIKIFNIPIGAEESQIEDLNLFLRANKIIDVKRELAMLDGRSCWSFCITYMLNSQINEQNKPTNGTKIDYKDMLDSKAFQTFTMLRKIRKGIADEEAVPAYAIFTDAELAEISKLQTINIESIRKIPGIGKKKVEKYGNIIVESANHITDETDRKSDGADSKS